VQSVGAGAFVRGVAGDSPFGVLDRNLLALRVPPYGNSLARPKRGVGPLPSPPLDSDSSTANACWRTCTICRMLPAMSRGTLMSISAPITFGRAPIVHQSLPIIHLGLIAD
jgi:hypothetical protein